MNCFTCERNLSAYLDDELPMDERIELEGHLDACAACRIEFESHQTAWEAAHRATAEAAPDTIWQGIEGQFVESGAGQTGIEELALMMKGLAADVQQLRQVVDGLRRDLQAGGGAYPEAYGTEPESIRVRSNPFRPGTPREASIDQLRSGA